MVVEVLATVFLLRYWLMIARGCPTPGTPASALRRISQRPDPLIADLPDDLREDMVERVVETVSEPRNAGSVGGPRPRPGSPWGPASRSPTEAAQRRDLPAPAIAAEAGHLTAAACNREYYLELFIIYHSWNQAVTAVQEARVSLRQLL